jgi:hypothetical protein
MSNTKFIQRGGKQVFMQPFAAKGVDFYGFLINADFDSIQKNLCDKYFNDPSNGSENFQPAGPFVLLVFNKINSLRSENPPDSEKGWFSEQEAAIWILLEDKKRKKLYWFHPYIFVDNSYAMAMGRELYGFPKSLGWFNIPDRPEEAQDFSIDTIVLPKFNSSTKGERKTLFAVKQTDPRGHSVEMKNIEVIMKDVLNLFKNENSFIDDIVLGWHSASDLLHGRVPMAFLKQFPDVTNPANSCYQAILEVPSKMTHFNKGSLLNGNFEVTINNWDSHPVASDLGLKPSPFVPLMSFYINFDFEIGNGKVIWTS